MPMGKRGGTGPTSVVFLYSSVGANFAALSAPFVAACGGTRARIALLLLPNSARYEARYREAWRTAGAGEIDAIYPPENLVLENEQLRTLQRSTGIFMSGGDTSLYRTVYGRSGVARAIRERHAAGRPYGGVSAGAMMACGQLVLEGSTIKTRANEFQLVADSSRASPKFGAPGLTFGKGLGLVHNCVLEPHFTTWGRFPRIVEAMHRTRSRFGLGLDDSVCLEVRGGVRATVRGRGRFYLFRRKATGTGRPEIEVRVYEPGARFELSDRNQSTLRSVPAL